MAITQRQVKNKKDSKGILTGKEGVVYDVNIKYTTTDGKKKTYAKRGFLTKKEASLHESEMKLKLNSTSQITTVTMGKQTVQEYMEKWLNDYAKGNLRPATYSNYCTLAKNSIYPYIGNVPLNKLTSSTADSLFSKLLEKKYKSGTVLAVKRLLSVALNHAKKYGYIDSNVTENTFTKLSVSEKQTATLTTAQLKELFEHTEGSWWQFVVLLSGFYGLRRSEALGLRTENINLEKGYFIVREQLPYKVNDKDKIITEMAPTKSKERILPITEYTKPFFINQINLQMERKENAFKKGSIYYDNGLIVSKNDGRPILPSNISMKLKKILKDVGLPQIKFHDLRRSAATNIHELTGDFFTVGDILGHSFGGISSSLGIGSGFESVTTRYVNVRMETKKMVLEKYHNEIKNSSSSKLKSENLNLEDEFEI